MLFKGTHISNPTRASIILMIAGFLVIGGGFFFVASLGEEVLEQEKFAVDGLVSDFVSTINPPWMAETMGYITEAGSVWFLTLLSVLVVAYLLFISDKSKWVALFLAVNMLGISGLTKGLKLLFERQRPEVIEAYDGVGYSFPSGHSTGAITFYGFMIYLVVVSRFKNSTRWILGILLGLFGVTVAVSRIFVGVHYFTDVMAGIALGTAWLLVSIAGLEIMLFRKRRRARKKEEKVTS
ncbi:phosphatase PAP2 family protein [Salimicrobium halophilum]|uniref:Undecaprenyl-diphosphatase n=1 Tax=Salimicrobium halophilum TaxID=86666 RepID=A0A1G8TPI5_9BACI|nr:phosphatase PAP2 family protein [Salimicrobium halophilum]SDJ43442.1 undecaprenyl-diphosphatase [Salimicrobium halophilum]